MEMRQEASGSVGGQVRSGPWRLDRHLSGAGGGASSAGHSAGLALMLMIRSRLWTFDIRSDSHVTRDTQDMKSMM
jgi:hypothetical protein